MQIPLMVLFGILLGIYMDVQHHLSSGQCLHAECYHVESCLVPVRPLNVKTSINCCPEYMRDNFIQVSEVHSYSTRHSLHNFKVPSVNNISKSTFYYNAVQDWNQLPENIKNKKTQYGFRKEIKSFLNSLQIQKENSEWVI